MRYLDVQITDDAIFNDGQQLANCHVLPRRGRLGKIPGHGDPYKDGPSKVQGDLLVAKPIQAYGAFTVRELSLEFRGYDSATSRRRTTPPSSGTTPA